MVIDWPPEKPTSTRFSSCLSSAIHRTPGLGWLHQLSEHTPRSGRVEERHEAPSDAAARLLVDHGQPTLPAELERCRDVLAPVGGVVDSRSALRKELADRRILPERGKQLDVGITDAKERRLHTLLGDGFAMLDRHLEKLAVELDGR